MPSRAWIRNSKQPKCRGCIHKITAKKAHILQCPFSFGNIPPTSIRFDPYAIAPSTQRPPKDQMSKDGDLQKLWDWANGKSRKDLFKHPNECNRFMRAQMKKLLEKTFRFPYPARRNIGSDFCES